MKRILLLGVLISASLLVHAQRPKKEAADIIDGKMAGIFPVDETGKITYSNVVTVDSTLRKEELYWRAKNFFFENMKSGKNVVQYEDKAEGVIAGKAIADYLWYFLVAPQNTTLFIPIKIQVKDGKYRYEMTGITLDERNGQFTKDSEPLEKYTVYTQKKSMVKADEILRNVAQLIETSMKKPSKKKDW